MREPLRRSLARLVLSLALLTAGALGAAGLPRAARADAPSASLAVLNGRTGLIHVTATGLPPDTLVWIALVTQPIADPANIVTYFKVTTSDDGTVDTDDASGVFICGTYVRVAISLLQPTYSVSPPTIGQLVAIDDEPVTSSPSVLGQCPATSPVIGITGVANGVAQISGQGFNIEEVVSVSVSSAVTGFVTGVTARTDEQGGLSAAVPLGAITCPDTLTPHATGLAGSVATGAPFAYVCPPPPAAPTSTPDPHSPANDTAPAAVSAPVSGAPHLTLVNGPARIGAHHLETVRVETGVPGALLRAVFSAADLPPAAFSVRADNQGRAHIAYMAPLRVPAGAHVVHFTISYAAGDRTFRQGGSFTVVGP